MTDVVCMVTRKFSHYNTGERIVLSDAQAKRRVAEGVVVVVPAKKAEVAPPVHKMQETAPEAKTVIVEETGVADDEKPARRPYQRRGPK